MPQIYEAYETDDGEIKENADGGRATVKWIVLEEANLATAAALVRVTAPLTKQPGLELLIRLSMSHKRLGPDSWEFTVSYGSEDGEGGGGTREGEQPPEPGTWTFSFDTTGGQQNKTHAPLISRHWNSLAPAEAPTLGNAINFHDRRPEGVEIVIPSLRFTITAYYEASDVTTNFMKELSRKTGSVNNDAWLGFAAGEVLYHGGVGQGDIPLVSGQRVKPIAIAHQFEASENQASVSVSGINTGKTAGGSTITAIAKKGWEYMWIRTVTKIEDNYDVPVSKHVYVNDVYERKLAFRDFFGFG